MKSTLIKNFLNKFFAYFLVFTISSCSSLTPYKVPILQGNIFDEDVYKELLNRGENIGLASVYRVLTQFETAGIVKKHHFEGSHAVYEVIEESHEHMVDVESGKVLEFRDNELIERLNSIAEDAGYQLVDHNLVLHVKKLD